MMLTPLDDEHPGHEALEAYVEGRLSADEAAAIDRLAASSRIVAEDLADLKLIDRALAMPPSARRDIRCSRVAAIAAIAASVMIAVGLNQRPSLVFDETIAGRATSLNGEERARIAAVIRDGHLTLPASIASLSRPQATLLGTPQAPASFALHAPLGTAVLSTTPLFSWDDAEAEAYSVALFDENFSEVARARVQGTSWQPDVPLKRGATYAWQVTAHRGAVDDTEPKPPQREARFTVVDAATEARVLAMQARLNADPLSLGILLADEGLMVEAKRQLLRAAAAPPTADAAGRLLAPLNQGTPITTKPAQ